MKKYFALILCMICFSSLGFGMESLSQGFVEVATNPVQPTDGQDFSIFLTVDNESIDGQGLEPVLNAKFDGQDVDLLNPVSGLWMVILNRWSGSYPLEVKYSVRNKYLAQSYRDQISEAAKSIAELDGRILIEDDPTEKDLLIQEKTQKEAELTQLTSSLESLKSLVVEESFTVEVLP